MRRVAIENDFMRTDKDAFLRVRDEGDKVTLTYKQFDSLSVDGAKEIEVEVSDYDKTVAILAQAGLPGGGGVDPCADIRRCRRLRQRRRRQRQRKTRGQVREG